MNKTKYYSVLFGKYCAKWYERRIFADFQQKIFSFESDTGGRFITWQVTKGGVFSGPYFLVLGLNTEIYFVNFRIQSEYWKLRTRKNSVFGDFSRSDWFNRYKILITITSTWWLTCFVLYND